MNICVFCASAGNLPENFYHEAEKLGRLLGERKWKLVYGGTRQGLMERVAGGVLKAEGKVTGIVPRSMVDQGLADSRLTGLIVTPDMKTRKERMREEADAFIALPGGWGTWEEITEVITLKHLGQHRKPVVFLNTGGFYDTFFRFISEAKEKHAVLPVYDSLYRVEEHAAGAISYIEACLPDKTEKPLLG